MPVLHCPRCQRANPAEASFCHYDGSELRVAPGSPYRGAELGREFVFPSGRRCKTYDELVRGCSAEWGAARRMLQQGGLRQFLAGIGRMDLALAADSHANQADLDVALDQFLARLPTREPTGPKLELNPRRVNAGKLKPGESRQFTLTISNTGSRLLHGTLQVEGEDWLSFGPNVPRSIPIKTGKQQQQSIHIDTFGLVAGQKYAANLKVDTNGGVFEVPVQVEVVAVPFPHAPLEGATTARELAYKMRDVPKQAVPLLETGEVERWFTLNGWRYPVQGPPASGIAAVQQFFEGMGVSKPPPLTVSDESVLMICRAGQTVSGRVTLKTSARKWVFGRVESDVPWLVPLESDVAGAQQALIQFQAASEGLPVGQRQTGRLTITANGGQKFRVLVHFEVRPRPVRLGSNLMNGLAVGALAGFTIRFLGSLPDLYTRELSQFGAWLTYAPPTELRDYVRLMTLATAWIGIPVGGLLLLRRGGLRDLPAGLITGGISGLIVAATLACIFPAGDRLLQPLLPLRLPGLAIVGWTLAAMFLLGAASLLGSYGSRLVALVSTPFAAFAGALGLRRVERFLRGE